MNTIEKIKEAFAGEPAAVEIEALIVEAGEALTSLKLDAEAAHRRMLDLSNEDAEMDRQKRDRLRGEAERIEAAIEQLKTSTLPEAQEREEQARRTERYSAAKEHLAAALKRDEEFDSRLSWLCQTMAINEQIRGEVAAANAALPDGLPQLDCVLPASQIEERVLAMEPVLVWCQINTTDIVPESDIRDIADTRMHARRNSDPSKLAHRHVGMQSTVIPAHSRLEKVKPVTTIKLGARVEDLSRERQEALLGDELNQTAIVPIRSGGLRMNVERSVLPQYLAKGAEIDTEAAREKIRVVR